MGDQSRKAQIVKIIIGAIFVLLAFAMDTPTTVLGMLAFGLPLLAWAILPEFLPTWKAVLASVGGFVLLFGLAVALSPSEPVQTESVSRSIGSQTADVPPDTTVAFQTLPPVTTTAAAPAESTTAATTTAPATTVPATTQATSAPGTATTAATTTAKTTAATTTTTTTTTTTATTTPQTTTAATTTTTATTAATTTTTAAPETTTTTAATITATTTAAATKAYHAPTNAANVIEVDGTNQCYRNQNVKCVFYGYPNTEYRIVVHYVKSTGTADGLENHTSNSAGFVQWSWKVGGNSTPGDCHIDIIGGGETVRIPFTVLESN